MGPGARHLAPSCQQKLFSSARHMENVQEEVGQVSSIFLALQLATTCAKCLQATCISVQSFLLAGPEIRASERSSKKTPSHAVFLGDAESGGSRWTSLLSAC